MSDKILNLLTKLSEMDLKNDSPGFVREGFEAWLEIPIDQQCLLIFHAWRAGKLAVIRGLPAEGIQPEVLTFLKAHELRTQGLGREAFELLKETAQRLPKIEIVQFRYIAEAIEWLSLEEVRSLMANALALVSPNRQLSLLFNFGIAANNQSNFPVVQTILEKLKVSPNPIAQEFWNWLEAARLGQVGDNRNSSRHYQAAFEIAETIPARHIDLAIIANNILYQSLWIGASETAELYFEKHLGKSRNNLGVSKGYLIIDQAIVDLLKGDLVRGIQRLKSFYSTDRFSYEHLYAAFIYLWALVLEGSFGEIENACEKLEQSRQEIEASDQIWDFRLFKILGRSLTGQLSRVEASDQIEDFLIHRSYFPQESHLRWGRMLLPLFAEFPLDRIESLKSATESPILGFAIFSILARDPELNDATAWNYAASLNFHSDLTHLVSFQQSLSKKDPIAAIQSLNLLSNAGWASVLPQEKITPLRRCQRSSLFIDRKMKRVLAPRTAATLDQQRQLNDLLVAFVENLSGLDKETIWSRFGQGDYHPFNHDNVIYTMLARLRDWLKKNAELDLLHTGQHWRIDHPERISFSDVMAEHISPAIAFRPEIPPSTTTTPAPRKSPTIAIELTPRQLAILDLIQRQGHLAKIHLTTSLKIKRTTAVNDLNQLVKLGLIKKGGKGRGVFYRYREEGQ